MILINIKFKEVIFNIPNIKFLLFLLFLFNFYYLLLLKLLHKFFFYLYHVLQMTREKIESLQLIIKIKFVDVGS